MRRIAAGVLVAGALGVIVVLVAFASAVDASAASFGVKVVLAGTCKVSTCSDSSSLSELFTQAAGHPNYGITDFKVASVHVPGAPGTEPEAPVKPIKRARVDLPVGLSINPEAVPRCSMADFTSAEAVPGKEIFAPSLCTPETVVGKDLVTVVVEPAEGVYADVPLEGVVYNLQRPEGVPAEFGVAVSLAPLGYVGLYAHTLLEGGVSWHAEAGVSPSGDYHEYFKINHIGAEPPLLESRLEFNGNIGTGGFLTLPSECDGGQSTQIEAESYEGEVARSTFTTPIGATGCNAVPFAPEVKLEPSTSQSDAADAATVRVIVPQNSDPNAINSSALKSAEVRLPEGMSLNPAAAAGLEACSDAQFEQHGGGAVTCPAGSRIGAAQIETPTLPPGALAGSVYVGEPLTGASPSSGSEYRIFIDAESKRYGVSVRLEGRVHANESTGQLSTLVTENPQTSFHEFVVELNDAAHAPLANPLLCGAANTSASLVPYSAPASTATAGSAFTVNFNGGACASPLPFGIAQSASASPTTGGANTSFTLDLTRPEGNQYLSSVSTTLPEGLIATIPTVPQCTEAQANAKSCPAASAIGTATVTLGSGPKPYALSGTVYLTGPVAGVSVKAFPQAPPSAPYGLLVLVNAEKVGPYDYGVIATRAAIDIDPHTARVIVSGTLPTIEGGVPLRMRSLTIYITHPNFMVNPTSCAQLVTDTSLTSTLAGAATLATPFQATGCEALSFTPQLRAYSSARHTRKLGASLQVTISQPAHEANIKAVSVTLPAKLPSRESTLKQACLEATFAADPLSCPVASKVGNARVNTPALPGTLSGPVYIVSHGSRAYPDLDIVLQGDGVTVILTGQTNIRKGITHTKFLTLPDVPIASLVLTLPVGAKSILAGNGSFCRHPMYMPTVIVAQNGRRLTQKTRIQMRGCPIEVLRRRVEGNRVLLVVKVPAAGRIAAGGKYLMTMHRRVRKAGRFRIAVPLTRRGIALLTSRHVLSVRVRVRFVAKHARGRPSQTFVRARFTAQPKPKPKPVPRPGRG